MVRTQFEAVASRNMKLEKSTGFEQTIEVQRTPSDDRRRDGGAIQLVQGSADALTSETDDLLRRRLRSASLVLFVGFLCFLVRSLFYLDRLESTLDHVMLANHVLVTVITGLVGFRLCMNCSFIAKHLRIFELVIFLDSAVFFMLLSYWVLTTSAPKGYLLPITPFWMMLLFVYALFIPNSLRRASCVIGSIAAAPIFMCIVLYWTSEAYAEVLRSNDDFSDFVTQNAMVMSLAAVSAIWGAHTMGSLREAAFEARRLGQYRLRRKLGEGGMGDVYLAEHMLLKRPCAVKVIKPERTGDPQALIRFEREVKATAELTHWNTIEIYDYGRTDDGTFYYVMEYLPGLNLDQLVRRHGPLPAGRVIHLLSQTCEALREAHQRGLIHRDIKPANIFAAHRGGVFDVVKLLDFGLARPITDLSDSSVTAEGTITGSPLFISPELVLGSSEADARSDVYSLGVVAYYLICGVPPFQSERPMEVMLAHARDEPPAPTVHQQNVPDDLASLILRCLEKDPNDRFQTMADLLEALKACEAAGTWTRVLAARWWDDQGWPNLKSPHQAALANDV